MATFKKARSQRLKFGTKARNENKRNRVVSFNHSDARVFSSKGYFNLLAFHAIFLNRSFGTNPKKFLGESNPLGRLKKES